MRKVKKIASNGPASDFVVDGEAQMFDTSAIDQSAMVSPRSKYTPVRQYTVPPKKVRGVGGVENGKSPRKVVTTAKKQYNGGSKKTGVVAGAVLGGAVVGGAAAYGANEYLN